MIRRSLVLLAALTMLLGLLAPASAGGQGAQTETADVVGQGIDGSVVAEGGATIRRTANSISIHLQMPTPEPGSYVYPDPEEFDTVAEPGHPEGFTLWAFVFNDPAADDWDGAFLVAGHLVGGDTLTLSGQVHRNTEPFVGDHLDNTRGAKVHLAVAPHGGLDDEIMPEQIQTPGGGPQHWWFALFD